MGTLSQKVTLCIVHTLLQKDLLQNILCSTWKKIYFHIIHTGNCVWCKKWWISILWETNHFLQELNIPCVYYGDSICTHISQISYYLTYIRTPESLAKFSIVDFFHYTRSWQLRSAVNSSLVSFSFYPPIVLVVFPAIFFSQILVDCKPSSRVQTIQMTK